MASNVYNAWLDDDDDLDVSGDMPDDDDWINAWDDDRLNVYGSPSWTQSTSANNAGPLSTPPPPSSPGQDLLAPGPSAAPPPSIGVGTATAPPPVNNTIGVGTTTTSASGNNTIGVGMTRALRQQQDAHPHYPVKDTLEADP